jgi:hypothetical protein
MKAARLTLLFALFFYQVNAQTFNNGSLEGSGTPCNRFFNFQFPNMVGNAGYAFGTTLHGPYPGMIYFFDGTCGEGTAQKGTDFLGLSSNDAGEVDAMSLTMTAPLLVNKTYVLKFYTKKSVSASTAPIALQIGYSNDSLAFGTVVDAVQPPTSTSWALQTVVIHPTTTSKYVTVRGVRSSTGTFQYSYTYVDNFTIAIGTGVSTNENSVSIAPHPNPFTTSIKLDIPESFSFPCQLTLTDVTGRIVHHQTVSNRQTQIDRGNISAGIYLLNVCDANGVSAHCRVVAQ